MHVNELRNVIAYLKEYKSAPNLWHWKLDLAIGLLELNLESAHERLGEDAIPDMAKILMTMLRGGASETEQYAQDCLRSVVNDHLRGLNSGTDVVPSPDSDSGK